jgi:hypothetical protein
MSEPGTSTDEIRVHLVRPGVGLWDYNLSVGATLADLLRVSGSTMENEAAFVDTVPLEETSPLHEGAVVTIAPRPANNVRDEPWLASIPAFQDESLFQEYSDALKARRHEVILDDESQDG